MNGKITMKKKTLKSINIAKSINVILNKINRFRVQKK
jgi:hypothetical protein